MLMICPSKYSPSIIWGLQKNSSFKFLHAYQSASASPLGIFLTSPLKIHVLVHYSEMIENVSTLLLFSTLIWSGSNKYFGLWVVSIQRSIISI